ncbi:hypothetical protein [Methylobacterium platani]|uniref:TNase-like domain-containing protein n=2 Tax=Methylobacterium platani TaxID=427683 RepID=A0A179S6L8_9HYPH|nr:hypothetical protein [Methylobacterium platani]KMO18405.1 hypothetical protein SQ03_10440 [Methylobacterium platani JCM 14648]OAS22999.1 hypothetical protein A5481_17810 [Methylobacterium platani]
MEFGRRSDRFGRVVEVGLCGQARYARMASGETIWWGSEEDVPDRVALAAAAARDAAERRRGTGGGRMPA